MAEILIADDHPAVLLGIKTFLIQKGHSIVSTCSNGIEAYNAILTKRPMIALLDISMPGMTGIEILQKISQNTHKVSCKLILLTLDKEFATFNHAKKLGAKGFLLKDFALDEIEACISTVLEGKTYFSDQLQSSLHVGGSSEDETILNRLTFSERKILQLISQQKSSREIAAMLFISEKTVETHRTHIIRKLNIPAMKNALLKWAIENKNSLGGI